MVGDHANRGPDGGRRSRPHWWAVLAVSLALLALVAATAGRSGDGGRRRNAAPAAPHRSAAPNHSPDAPTTTTTLATPTTTTPTVTSPTVPTTTVPPSETASVVGRQTPAATPTTTPVATPSSGTAAAARSAPPVAATQTQQGYLQQPDDASAFFTFTGVGSMQVSASWLPSTTLSLTVSCPSGTVTEEGTSPVTVPIPDADGPCDATLKETIVQYDAVTYTLTTGPSGGQ